MNLEITFKAANMIAIAGWLVMVVLHNHKYTARIIFSGFFLLLAICYLTLILSSVDDPDNGASFGSLPGVMLLFDNPKATLAGWIHYLAFDMMIGLFITLHSAKQGVNRFLILPSMFFTFMYGPVGLLIYYVMLCIKQKTALPTLSVEH